MKKKQKHGLNISNIKSFIEGHAKLLGALIHVLPHHIVEQVAYRADKCKSDCIPNKKCVYCDCDVPAKLYVNQSCNGGDRFPDLMNEKDWELFKSQNELC